MSQSISDWVEFSQKNKPQSNALSGGIILMLVTGLQVSWIFSSEILKFPWVKNHSSVEIFFAFATFYIAAAIGLYSASITIDRLTKSNVYVSCT